MSAGARLAASNLRNDAFPAVLQLVCDSSALHYRHVVSSILPKFVERRCVELEHVATQHCRVSPCRCYRRCCGRGRCHAQTSARAAPRPLSGWHLGRRGRRPVTAAAHSPWLRSRGPGIPGAGGGGECRQGWCTEEPCVCCPVHAALAGTVPSHRRARMSVLSHLGELRRQLFLPGLVQQRFS